MVDSYLSITLGLIDLMLSGKTVFTDGMMDDGHMRHGISSTDLELKLHSF